MKSRRAYGDGSVFKNGSDTWWIQYCINGQRQRESAHTTDEKVARALLRTRLHEAAQGVTPEPSAIRKLTMADLYEVVERDHKINKRKDLEHIERRWRLHLKPFFGFMRPANVSSDLITRYIEQRQQAEASNASINRELAVVRRAFKLGQQATPPKVHFIPHFPRLKEDPPRTGFLEPAHYKRLQQECARYGLWMRTLFELAHSFGWRRGELLNLRVSQVSIADKSIRLNPGETKNDEGREVGYEEGSLLAFLLQECVHGKRGDDYVLTRKDGKRVKDFRKAWATARERAGVPGYLFHDNRRTAVRNLVHTGFGEKVAMNITGHKTRSVFDRYHIINQADIRAAVKRLNCQNIARIEAETAILEEEKTWEKPSKKLSN